MGRAVLALLSYIFVSAALKISDLNLAQGARYTDEEALAFVGGYTVSGDAIIVDASLRTSIVNFAVDQECMCSCSTEAHGIFCLGASDSNMFTVIAFKEEGGWIMEQHSVNASIGGFNYHATLRLGTSPAGSARSASGYALTGVGAVETTQFHATHSATGCAVGIGASSCVGTCEKFGINTTQLTEKCGF
uniref:Uncharacterized protein n=1 Tax=Noctiluca scintillans TaxID=2966 RepID=A0A7S1AZW0_NOCSC|mmetsp:Transcript_7113/g.19519  ORF Transcript_7113/g.19519 Transcript_7113/m.19519 type:complete len:190 (+) Transcript_7113:76-645(+)